MEACDVLEGYVVGGNDCDDDNDTVFPAAEELCIPIMTVMRPSMRM